MDALTQWNLELSLALQKIGGLTGPMKFFTFLGTENFFLLFLPAVYWCIDSALGLRLAVVVLSANSLSATLKLAFHLPRPYWIDSRVKALSTELTYGLPSGHALDAAAIWGFSAAQLKRRWAWPAALGVIFLISLSRLYLGVHFATDVLGGLAVRRFATVGHPQVGSAGARLARPSDVGRADWRGPAYRAALSRAEPGHSGRAGRGS
jgi:membrane-associated phospholipid phosphatase